MSKKKKYILIGIGAILLISLLSIGGGEDSAPQEVKQLVLKAAQTELKGDLKGCYELVDKDYNVKFGRKSYENDVVTIELKRTNKELPYKRDDVVIFPDAEKSSANYCAGFGVEILDANGDVICKQNANATPYSWDDMTAALQLLPEETTTLGFHFDNLSEAVSFRVTSIVQKNEERKTALEKEAESLMDAAKKAADIDDDLEEEAEAALKMAGETMELAGKMLDLL